MKPIVAGLFLTLVLVAGGRAWLSRSNEALPSLPAQPARVPVRLLQAQPFFLDEGWIHEWRAERPVVDAGYLLVIQTDPELPGVGLVVFDEVHERNLATDLGLALTLDARANLRPDLRVVAMSATPDTESLVAVLDDPAVIESEGRMHPVDVRWVPRERRRRIEDATAATVGRALREEEGDVLVFLPGIGEISRTGHLS